MDKISEGLPPHAHPMRRPELPDLRLRNRPPSTSRMYVSNSRACVPAGTAERATAHWQHTRTPTLTPNLSRRETPTELNYRAAPRPLTLP